MGDTVAGPAINVCLTPTPFDPALGARAGPARRCVAQPADGTNMTDGQEEAARSAPVRGRCPTSCPQTAGRAVAAAPGLADATARPRRPLAVGVPRLAAVCRSLARTTPCNTSRVMPLQCSRIAQATTPAEAAAERRQRG